MNIDEITKKIRNDFYSEDFNSVTTSCDYVYLHQPTIGEEKFFDSYQSLDFIFYSLLGYMGIGDYYQALQLIKHCKVFNNPVLQCFRESDGANYYNLLNEDEKIKKVMILVIFLESNKNLILDLTTCEDYVEIGINYFEMISSLYELGYSNKIIKEMTDIGHIIYKI